MPEIKNEVPSEQELRDYFHEHWEWRDEYFREQSEELGVDFTKLSQKVYDTIFASLMRLNELPRDHKFWKGTNKRPTIYKLDDFCQFLLEQDSSDELALWTQVVASFPDFSVTAERWQRLWQIKKFDIEILLYSYLIMHAEVYEFYKKDLAEYLAKILININAVEDVQPNLSSLLRSKNSFVSQWASRVLTLISKNE